MRWVVGLLLCAAALLKAAELIWEPAAILTTPWGAEPVPLQVAVELGFGLLALSGLFWSKVRPIALALIAGFSIYSLYQAIGEATSCGCFGPVNISPWWTFLLDIAVVVGLLISIRRSRRKPDPIDQFHPPVWLSRQPIVAGFVAFSVISAAILGRQAANRTALAGESLTAFGGLVVLEPETRIGKRLPIADAINLDVIKCMWIVLLHWHDCPKCQEATPKYEELAEQHSGWQIALVDVPPYDGSVADRNGNCHDARLNNNREWFVQTPVEIQLADGIVTSASHELPALSSFSGH